MSLCGASWLWAKSAAWRSAGWPTREGEPRTSLLRSNMTTVRNLKDEIDKRAHHKMLKQLCLSERDFE